MGLCHCSETRGAAALTLWPTTRCASACCPGHCATASLRIRALPRDVGLEKLQVVVLTAKIATIGNPPGSARLEALLRLPVIRCAAACWSVGYATALPRTGELFLHVLLKLFSGCVRVGIAVCHRVLSGPPRTGELQDLQIFWQACAVSHG